MSLRGIEKDNLLGLCFSFYTKRIIAYVQQYQPNIFIESCAVKEENLRALVILPEILPIANFKSGKRQTRSEKEKVKSVIPSRDLLRILKEGTNIEAAEKNKRSTSYYVRERLRKRIVFCARRWISNHSFKESQPS
ncbi:uncharacterized protein LOC117179898 [Belonocnema kinseyi]|uniref:uncharacterized protein LOC117179898 n=1 Tax=Belonocnema kinseyi TaxID=2817044 RepID=UPI00143CCBB3|nr:uncharacterized protein LOC117179898 [Belonocnema kinseyi]